MMQSRSKIKKTIDPVTGLPLDEIQPAPPSRAVDPFGEAAVPVPSPATAVQPMQVGGASPAASPLPESSFLDKVIFTMFGTPDSKLSEGEQKEKQTKRKNASAMATGAAENPGESHMGIPSAGGDSFGSTLTKILSLFAKPG